MQSNITRATRTPATSHMLVALACCLVAPIAGATIVNFEDTPFGVVTVLGDRYLSEGLRISGAGPFSGVSYSEGMFGVKNFGNSSTQVMDIGLRTEPTFLRFVDPLLPSVTLGATSVSFLAGDGDADSETFAVSFYDTSDVLLSTTTYTTTTGNVSVTATSDALGALIGLVRLEVLRDSGSGAVIDDLTFFQGRVIPVSAPSTLLLVMTGAIAASALRRRRAESLARS